MKLAFNLLLISIVVLPLVGQDMAESVANPVFVFNNAFNQRDFTYSQIADLLVKLGYDGIEHRETKDIFELKKALDKNNLSLIADYVKVDIDAEIPYDQTWKEVLPQLVGSDLILWVHIHSDHYESSDPAADSKVVPIIQELADLAEPFHIRIAIYPHVNFLAETPQDGLRIATLAKRENVGTAFNLCHFLKTDEDENLEQVIDKIFPKLFAVSISGADKGDTRSMRWDRLIQPLGEGSYDVYKVMSLLWDRGYQGPVGFQCYQIPGKPEQFLKTSIQTWNHFKKLYASHTNRLTPKEIKRGWQLLFDGHSSNGWRGISRDHFPKYGWQIQAGEISINAQLNPLDRPGDIVTQKEYGDFELVWDWKMGTKGGNSGIKYFVNESLTTDGKYGYGLEYQILDDANHPWMLEGKMKPNDYHTCGALYEFFAPSPDKVVKSLGEWNSSRIRSKNNRVEHWLNGERVLKYKRGGKIFKEMLGKSKFKDIDQFGMWESGRILLQDHSSDVSFRNIKIREL